MSYEKKMKDLLGRLVAMSPEPPPYPEESPMATSEPPRRRVHPALVFAGAAALVAALAVPVILFTGDGPPVAGGTTTTTTVPATSTSQPGTSSTTTGESTTTTTPSTTSTVAASTWRGTVFLYQTPENSFLSNPALVPIQVEVTDPTGQLGAEDAFTTALAAMAGELPPGMQNAIPADVEIESLRFDGQTVIADMNEAFVNGAGGLLGDFTMLNQLIYTLTFDSYESVVFTVGGQPIEAFGTDGLDLSDPVDRRTFIEDLALIFLTQPLVESEGAYVVAGFANTYEAVFNVNVLDGDGDVVYDEFDTASCGTGCWGDFAVSIDASLVVPGESVIRVFSRSAEDGSDIDVITVPVFEDHVWRVAIG